MTSAADLLRRKADDYRALAGEHAATAGEKVPYRLLELTLREVADALEQAEIEREREAA